MIDKTKGNTLYFSQWGGERPIPDVFIAAMERAEERQSGYAIDQDIPDAVKNDPDVVEAFFDSRERRTNEKTLVVIRKKNGIVGPLLDRRTTAEGLSVQVAATMFRTADATFVHATASSTQDVSVKDLGNGWSIQEVAVSGTYVGGVFTPAPFSRDSYTKERLNLIPEKFRGLVPTLRTKNVVDGQAAIPTLGAGELLRSEEDLTAFRKLVEVLTINNLAFPIDIIDTAVITEYGGGPVNVNQRLAVVNTLTVEQGEDVVSSKVTKIGEGHELRDTIRRQAGAWPVMYFSRFDARLQLVISGTKQVVALGSSTGGISGNNITEVREIDGYREERIITVQPISVVDAYIRVLHGNTTNVDVPPHLESLTGYVDAGGGNGSYSENGGYSLGGSAYGGGNIQLRGNAQASAVAIPELGWVVKIPRTSNIPCIHVLFYVANGTSRASIITVLSGILGGGGVTDWPNFRPQPLTIKGVGAKTNINAQVNVSAHDSVTVDYLGAMKFNSYSRSAGAGSSFDSSITTKIFNVPATIHDNLSIGGLTDAWAYYAARATINGGVSGASADTGTIVCGSRGLITAVSSLLATTGDNAIPSSGLRVHRLVSEPDGEFNRTRVFAEVVDFTDITP